MTDERVDKLITEVRNMAELHPDAIYNRPAQEGEVLSACFYTQGRVSDGPEQEGCIVGQALSTFLERSEVEALDQAGENRHPKMVAIAIGPNGLDWSPSERQTAWLKAAQQAQDGGATWGAAVERANKLYRSV